MEDKPLLSTLQSALENPADLIVTLLLDCSGSVGEKGFGEQKLLVLRILDQIPGVKTEIVKFASTAEIVCPFTRTTPKLVESLNSMVFQGGGTNMRAAFSLTLDTLKNNLLPESKPLIIFITDGIPDSDPSKEIKDFMALVRTKANFFFF